MIAISWVLALILATAVISLLWQRGSAKHEDDATRKEHQESIAQLQQELAEHAERLAALESIVTESDFELKQKLDALK